MNRGTRKVGTAIALALAALAAAVPGGGAATPERHCTLVEAGPPGPAGNVLEIVAGGELNVYRARGERIFVSYAGPPCTGGPFTVRGIDSMDLEGSPVAVSESGGRFAPGATDTGSGAEIEIHARTDRLEYAGSPGADRVFAATLAQGRVALDLHRRRGGQAAFDLIATGGIPEVLRIKGESGDDLIDARRITGMGDPQLRRRIRLEGNGGDDTLFGSDGVEWRLKDGPGDDLVRAGGGNDEVSLDRGHDTVYGGAGDDVISYDAFERFTGTPPDPRDRLFAGPGDDLLSDLNRHSDLIRCGPGRDHVSPERFDHPAADCD